MQAEDGLQPLPAPYPRKEKPTPTRSTAADAPRPARWRSVNNNSAEMIQLTAMLKIERSEEGQEIAINETARSFLF